MDKTYFHQPILIKLGGTRGHFFSPALYRAVDRASTDSIVSWSSTGKSFIIWNQEKFCIEILPRLWMNKWTTFIGRLKSFGFRVVESGHLEFAHDDFVRGNREQTMEIERKFIESFNPNNVPWKTSKALKEEDLIIPAVELKASDM